MTEEATLNGVVIKQERDSHLMAWPMKPLLGYFKLTQSLEL
jgi:hypothetical protein